MKNFICAVLMLLSAASLKAQLYNMNSPDIFIGNWKGKLQWIQPGKTAKEFTMQLIVSQLDSIGFYSWTIIYGDSGKDNRPYTLKPVDADKGHWIIDEHNGIMLDNYMAGNCMQGSFTVMNNTITNNYCIENGKLKVEFFSMKLADKKTSGKGTEESPSVDSYRMTGYQVGLLEKVN